MLMDAMAVVRAYYDQHAEREWRRLTRSRIEFAVTLRALRDNMRPESRVLDVGGGPGRYAVALAAAGHRVTLLDLAPRLLTRARQHAEDRTIRLEAIVEGAATDLSRFDTGSFDVLLLLGPLYHLPDFEDRARALREARRVLAPSGLLVAAFLGRYAPLRALARLEPQQLLRRAGRYETLLESGFLPPPYEDDEPPYAYYALPEEVGPLLEGAGFDAPHLLACEGILDGIDDRVTALQGPAWDAWADLNYDLAGDPSVLGAAAHLLAVTRRSTLA